jgi:hypothetical protein
MGALLSGEHRRAAILGVAGGVAVIALLVFRVVGGGAGSSGPPAPVSPALPTTPVPSASVTGPSAPAPAASPAVDPSLLRDPFCPLAAAAAPGSAPVVCRPRVAPPGGQAVGLEDIFVEAGVRLARMHVGPFTFPNLHEGDTFADSFRVVSLSERCGEFDSAGKPFPLCEGEEAFE